MPELNKEDLEWCIKRLPHDVKSALKNFPTKLSVGGGFIRSCITGDELKDVDLFVDSDQTAKEVIANLKTEQEKPFKTKNAYTVFRGPGKPNTQIIIRWLYPHPEKVIYDFDFSICCSVIWYENKKFHSKIHKAFYQDLAARRLRYTSPDRNEDAGGSLLRILKYYKKGYKITLDSYGKVIARMVDKLTDLKSKSHWKDDNYTREDHLAKLFVGFLVEVDPNSVREDQTILGADTLEDQEDDDDDFRPW